MTREILVALDAGTSMIKALAFGLDGAPLASASRPNRYECLPDGGVVQDMRETWRDAAAALRDLAERIRGLGGTVFALAVTGQGDGTWLVDRAGEPVAPAMLWLDSRAADVVAELHASGLRRELYRYTGCGLNPCNQSAQLVWLQRHMPEALERAATAFHCKDWLYFKLTGTRAVDVSEGTFTFGNFRTRRYEPEILDWLGLSAYRRLLPEMVDGSTTTHPLDLAAAVETGLPAGIPVTLGYVDVVCTALGAGLYEPTRSIGCSIVGSTGMHMRFVPLVDDLALPAEPGGYTMPFPVAGSASRMESNMAATLNIDWVSDIACEASGLLGRAAERGAALAAIDARVLEALPAAALFHPYIHAAGERGPFLDPLARAQLTGLSAQAGFLELARAVYEGLAMAARDCYAAMGDAPEEIRIAGGAARSKALKLILASAMGAPVRESAREEAGAAGAAMMASVAIGIFPDMAAAAAVWVAPLLRAMVTPDPELQELYGRMFPIYVATRKAMTGIWPGLAAARGRRGG
jgi:erythritol kinase (D-erythritol 1-phosphate-forming)